LNAILPERCCLCLQRDGAGFCHQCQQLLPWIGCCCQYCGKAMAITGICGRCQNTTNGYDQIIVPFNYQPPISSQIHQLKYHSQLSLAPSLAKMLAMQVITSRSPLPEVLVPVPLHRKRLQERGFNQAELIARHTGKLLGIPVDYQLVSRMHNTVSQTELTASARRKNMQDAFAVSNAGRYDAVAVIDDVITSGATMNAVCRELRRHKFNHINAWAIARA
jgi:ComF family protein